MIYDIMGEKAKNFWNRVGNTAMIGPRTIGTGLNTVTDTVDTVVEVPKRLLSVGKNTIHEIKKVLVEPWKYGKWYQKVGNIALSPLIATGVAIEGAGKAALTPAELAVDTWNTAKNTVTNGWRSTFGRLFSKKPLSDFSYDKLKTANFINKDKFRVSKLQFGKKDGAWVETPSTKKSSGKEAATTAATTAAATTATAATAAAVGADKIKELTNNFEQKLKKMEEGFNDKIKELFAKNKELLDKNTALAKENAELKKTNEELKKAIDLLKSDDKSADKPVDKPVEVKADDKGSNKERNPSAENVEKKTEPKKEDKPTAVKEEKKPEAKKEDGGDKGKVVDVHRIAEMIGTEPTRRVCNYIKSSHPNMTISFKNDTAEGHSHLGDSADEYITIGTENPKIVRMICTHEFYHVLHHDKINGTGDLLDYVTNLSQKSGKQLSTIAYEYSEDERPIENCAEIFSKFLLGDSVFDKYMEFLQSGKDNKLIKISQTDAEKIKELCGKIISNLDTTSENTEHKTVKMFQNNEADITYSAAA